MRTSGKDVVDNVYLTTSKSVRQGDYVLPLKMFRAVIDWDFQRGYTAVGKQLFRTCKGLTTGSLLSVYLAVLCVFYALYNINNIARSTIHLVEEYVGQGSTFKFGLLDWIDDFVLFISTAHVSLKHLMNKILKQHLSRFRFD